MSPANSFAVFSGLPLMLTDLGLSPDKVLRRAALPDDLFARKDARLSTKDFFRLWRGIEEEADDPLLPIKASGVMSAESFSPSIFAALCSANLNQALDRIARYKRLTCPMTLHVEARTTETSLEIEWHDKTVDPPVLLAATDLVFFVQLARMATRCEIRPRKVFMPKPPSPVEPFAEYFGAKVEMGSSMALTFAAEDAVRPFLTMNEPMWRFFEPELKRRLFELDQSASVEERVRAALLELLPAGRSSIQSISDKLGVSARTLQRRLRDEGETFQNVLNKTREELATYYLKNSAMSGAEISFLLGFEDPNSFFRAFHAWTGSTPQHARMSVRTEH